MNIAEQIGTGPNLGRSWIEETIGMLEELGPRGVAVLDAVLAEVPPHELAAVAHDWRTFARPAQIIEPGDWRSWGFLTGRGWGKTASVVSFLLAEVAAERVHRIALVGQSEQKTIEILVEGETGILSLCPPWLGAEWQSSSNRVLFGNGAVATVYTPQEPTGLRGPQHDLAIATEVASWPAATRAEAFSNLLLGLRLGRGQLLWDSTPKRRNPLIRDLLERSKKSPTKHIVVSGSTHENAINLSPDVVAEWTEAWGGTARGAEELDGRFFDDAEDALFKAAWIERARRTWPEKLTRRIISIDPAITANAKYSDATGIVDMGLGVDRQIYALRNLTGVHRPEVWPGMVIDAYVVGGCDVILIETNRGGSAWVALLRGAASARGLTLVELGPLEVPGNRPGVVYVRAFNSRGAKAVRASGAAALVERGRVSFVAGDLGDLEDRLCAFDGSDGAIDDSVDAFVAGCHELGGLGGETVDASIGFNGITELNALLHAPAGARPRPGRSHNIAMLIGGSGTGGRI